MKLSRESLPKLLLNLLPYLVFLPVPAALAELLPTSMEEHNADLLAEIVPMQQSGTAAIAPSAPDAIAVPTGSEIDTQLAIPSAIVAPPASPTVSPQSNPTQPTATSATNQSPEVGKPPVPTPPTDSREDGPDNPTVHTKPEGENKDAPTLPTGNHEEVPDNPTASDKPEGENKDGEASPKTPEELVRWQKLLEADRLYREGQIREAEALYREVKTAPAAPSTPQTPEQPDAEQPQKPQPFSDPNQLAIAGQVFWREAQTGIETKTQTRIFVPLQLLVERYPEFIPGQITLAEMLEKDGKPQEAADLLIRVANLYPDHPDLLRAKVNALAKTDQWLEAAISARQFALLNPENPTSAEFFTLADENMEQYKRNMRSKLRGRVIGNILTGALGYALTGNLFGPLSALQTTAMLIQGESGVGGSISRRAKRHLEIVDDKEVLDYVNEIGQKLAKVAGRNDFEYEFNVVLDEDLNAFALPGGKVFVNAGAITKTKSEAELAGLLAHELSHAVLSHSFQLVTQGNLLSNIFGYVPYAGGLITDLLVFDYSRDMERQADILGTRILVSAGYAADGMLNLMQTLKKEDKTRLPAFLSTHPGTGDRIQYLDDMIATSGYNRYAYEGVERHAQIQQRVKKLLQQKKEREEKQKK
jgi:predicted Zn-dependent protease